LARARDSHNLLIDNLLSRQMNLVEQPPQGWVEPKHRPDDFVSDGPQPVAAADVDELVARHGDLLLLVERGEGVGHDDHRSQNAERDRVCHSRGNAELRVGAGQQAGLIDRRRSRNQVRGESAQSAERDQPHAQPHESGQHAQEDDGGGSPPDRPRRTRRRLGRRVDTRPAQSARRGRGKAE
jgi:hypothetical protein